MIVYGAGLAGLLSANMLRRFKPIVREAQTSLPNNHSALLRFRTNGVGAACGIPFKKVKVQKAIRYEQKILKDSNLFFNNMYALKVTDSVIKRSINNLEDSERYIAPLDLISQMASNCDIQYLSPLDSQNLKNKEVKISTIPMPVLMKMVGWPEIPEFPVKPIWTQRGIIEDPNCEVYQTVYLPDPSDKPYRVSIIGNVVIAEYPQEPENNAGSDLMDLLRECFGFQAKKLTSLKMSCQKYGKIMPIDEQVRKNFIYAMTTEHNIYSVGRFATWRQLLLDDVVKDIQVVEKFIENKNHYFRLRKEINES